MTFSGSRRSALSGRFPPLPCLRATGGVDWWRNTGWFIPSAILPTERRPGTYKCSTARRCDAQGHIRDVTLDAYITGAAPCLPVTPSPSRAVWCCSIHRWRCGRATGRGGCALNGIAGHDTLSQLCAFGAGIAQRVWYAACSSRLPWLSSFLPMRRHSGFAQVRFLYNARRFSVCSAGAAVWTSSSAAGLHISS